MNRQGESQPLTGTSPITAKDPYSKPDKPGVPDVVDWDRDHVDLVRFLLITIWFCYI